MGLSPGHIMCVCVCSQSVNFYLSSIHQQKTSMPDFVYRIDKHILLFIHPSIAVYSALRVVGVLGRCGVHSIPAIIG